MQFFGLRDLQWKSLTECVILNTGEFTQSQMYVLRSNPNAIDVVDRERSGIDRHELLLFVRGSDYAIPRDPGAEDHDGADGPVVLAMAIVVIRCASHFTLNDDDQFVANLQILRLSQKIIDACEKLGNQFHLIDIVVVVAVKLTN